MKCIIMLLLALMAHSSLASFAEHPNKLLSQVCGNRYVYGTKQKLYNNQVVWMCLSKNSLEAVYAADISANCHTTHTETIWVFANNGMHFKECVLTSELGASYENYLDKSCAEGYETNSTITYVDVIFQHKTCYKAY